MLFFPTKPFSFQSHLWVYKMIEIVHWLVQLTKFLVGVAETLSRKNFNISNRIFSLRRNTSFFQNFIHITILRQYYNYRGIEQVKSHIYALFKCISGWNEQNRRKSNSLKIANLVHKCLAVV